MGSLGPALQYKLKDSDWRDWTGGMSRALPNSRLGISESTPLQWPLKTAAATQAEAPGSSGVPVLPLAQT